jgi:hypothetical protein
LADAEHMLLGLVHKNGTAASLLEAERDDDDLRAELTRLIDHPRGRWTSPDAKTVHTAVITTNVCREARDAERCLIGSP